MILPDTDMYLYRYPVDMRKQINGLIGIVSGEMQLDPMSSALFVFIGRTGDKLKILQYETNVFWLWYRVLQRQRFKWPTAIIVFALVCELVSIGLKVHGLGRTLTLT